jgi:hypothetical protein
MIFCVQTYFQAGAEDRGIALSKQLVDIFEKDLYYYESFPSKHQKFLNQHKEECVQTLGSLRYQILADKSGDAIDLLNQRLDRILENKAQF